LNAGGTALVHLARLKEINDQSPSEVRISGTKANLEFNNLLDTVADELGTFYGEPKTNEAIASKKATLGALMNRNAAIVEQARAMTAKLNSLQTSWDNAAPKPSYRPPMPNISSDARVALQTLAPDFVKANPVFAPGSGGQSQPGQTRQPGTKLPAAPAGKVAVQIPGSPVGFISQGALQQFQKDHPNAVVGQ
jgi:hypothetical protein